MPTHYEVLGVPEGAPSEEVRQAYRRLVKSAHPDLAGDAEQFRRVAQAYDVLSDPARRMAYDRGLRPISPPARPARRRPYGRLALLVVAASVVGGIASLAVATARQSVGDDCLVGTWRGEEFEVPFLAVLDGREVSAPIRGGAGVTLTVTAKGPVRTDYAGAAPLTGAVGPYRIEGTYAGTTSERWHAARGTVRQSGTDATGVRFQAMINGRAPDQPVAVTVLDREYLYTCTSTTLELGPYRYTRTEDSP